MGEITLYDYEKISDDLCFLGGDATLKFNVALARKGANDTKQYFHKEYEYESPFLDREKTVSIKRNFSYFLSIDVKTSFDSNIMIRPCDMIQLKIKLKKSLEWFSGNTFKQKNGNLIVIWDHNPIIVGGFLGNKGFELSPIIMDDKGGYEHPGVQMKLSTGVMINIESNDYLGFVYTITSIDMYGAALTMINYIPVNAGKNHYVIGEDGIGSPKDLNLLNHKVTTSKEKKSGMVYQKTSFFDKKISSSGSDAIVQNPQGGERKGGKNEKDNKK